jgi:hypothetical protein
MRKAFTYIWLLTLFLGVVSLFWYKELKYALPTPIPHNYVIVKPGAEIVLPSKLSAYQDKPLFLHFFNPDCPCSRFNIDHVRRLIGQYGDKARFVIILLTNKKYTEKEIQTRFDIRVPVLRDSSIALLCGVYSTPQAVIIDNQHKLFYRGNYNQSRYCTNRNSNYAQIALEALLKNNYSIEFNPLAVRAYGCQLPNCRK